MKKLLYFAVLTLLTACHADNLDEIAEAGGAVVPSEADRVPVQLSISPSSNTADMTRAPLATATNGNFETPRGDSPEDYEYLGVFALAQTNTPAGGNTSAVATGDIQWNSSLKYFCPLWNQPTMATIVDGKTTLQFVDRSTLNSTPTLKNCYYPVSSLYNYYFYAYYPRVPDNKVYVSNNVVTADYSLDGSQDIITGIAMSANSNAYCSKYFRDNSEATKPQLQLNHHLAQLRFFVCAKNNPKQGDTFQVKGITLLKVPSEWTLTIADKASTDNTGQLVSRDTTKTDIPVRMMTVNMSDNTMTSASDDAVYVNDYADDLRKTKKCAGYAMVPTTDMINTANSTLNRGFRDSLQIEIVTNSNDTIRTHLRTIKANGGFQAGKVYNVILTINQGAGGQTPQDTLDYRAVDLGLSVLWAKWNLGIDEVEDDDDANIIQQGLMYTWGAVNGYSAGHNFTKTNDDQYYGKVAGKEYWLSFVDAATTSWQNNWRLPTREEFNELINNTTHQWYDNYEGSGVSGYLLTSTKAGYTDKSIFMPVTGYGNGTSVSLPSEGFYWSSASSSTNYPYSLHFSQSSSPSVKSNRYRYYGLHIRPVRKK